MRTLHEPARRRAAMANAIAALAIGATMTEAGVTPSPTPTPAAKNADPTARATVRYQTPNVERAIAFYTQVLDFKLEQKSGPAFAQVLRGDLHLILSGP